MDSSHVPPLPPSRPPSAPRRRWRGGLVVLLGLAAALAGAGVRADEDPPGRVGRVAMVQGEVRTVNAEGAWVTLPRNRPLTTGNRVITDKDGRAVIEIGSSTVRLGPYSDMRITRLDDQVVRLHFDHGLMALRVRSPDIVGEIGVETDEGLWVPHHPGYFRFDRAAGGVLAGQAWSGDLVLEATDSTLPVAAGQRAEVWREGAQETTHYRLVPIPTDKFADWALVEDRLDDRNAAAAASSPVPAEMTGAADLNAYGKWSTAPDYGSVWTPSSVPSGWAPYQDGSWTWVAPWGWTWIDNAPWGFAPFHYGRWAFVGGHWCWVPGNWGPRPIYAPALVGWFGGDGFDLGGVPAVGWVPLAPFEPFYPAYPVSPIYWNLVNGSVSHPPIRRSPGPTPGHPRIVPIGPIVYTNRGAPNAVSIVPASALTTPQAAIALPAVQRADHRRLMSQATEGKVVALPPPAPPAGRGRPGGAAPAIRVPAAEVEHALPATVPGAATPARPATPVRPVGQSGATPAAAAVASTAVVPAAVAAPTTPAVAPAPTGLAATPAAPGVTTSRGGPAMNTGGGRSTGNPRGEPR